MNWGLRHRIAELEQALRDIQKETVKADDAISVWKALDNISELVRKALESK